METSFPGVHTDNNLSSFIDSFGYSYKKLSRLNPNLAQFTDTLFMNIVKTSINKGITECDVLGPLENLFQIWTKGGTRDISDAHAFILHEPLTKLFDVGLAEQSHVAEIVFRSPKLWNAFEKRILKILEHSNIGMCSHLSFKRVLYRHAPQRTDLHNSKDSNDIYRTLCCDHLDAGYDLSAMQYILTGPHHHALAWRVTIEEYVKNGSALNGKWMQMLETFSTLRLDPQDQDSWHFWHHLSMCCADDMSGRNLLSCLAETKHEMASAFADGWGIVDSLYEGHERYAHAARMYNTNAEINVSLMLPDCSS